MPLNAARKVRILKTFDIWSFLGKKDGLCREKAVIFSKQLRVAIFFQKLCQKVFVFEHVFPLFFKSVFDKNLQKCKLENIEARMVEQSNLRKKMIPSFWKTISTVLRGAKFTGNRNDSFHVVFRCEKKQLFYKSHSWLRKIWLKVFKTSYRIRKNKAVWEKENKQIDKMFIDSQHVSE